jgi:hypothetical protein
MKQEPKKNTHPLAWGTVDGPKGTDQNSWAARAAGEFRRKEAEKKLATDRLLWLAELESE